MPKRLIKKYMPDPEKLKQQKSLQFLGDRLHEPNLWHLNRRSVSLAFAVGLFAAWIPTPGQMAIAAAAAFYFRANLPISVALVWVTNPLTMPPMFYFAYIVGLKNILGALPSDTRLKRVFFVSSTSVYHQDDDTWVNETSPTSPLRFAGKILLDAELIPNSIGYASTSIRFSGIYGGTRNRLVQSVRTGLARLSPQNKLSNRIHEDDCVGFLLHLIRLASRGEELYSCYIATDSCPVNQNQVLEYLAEKIGVSLSVTESVELSSRAGSKRCSNKRMLDSAYTLRYPDFKKGYSSMLVEAASNSKP